MKRKRTNGGRPQLRRQFSQASGPFFRRPRRYNLARPPEVKHLDVNVDIAIAGAGAVLATPLNGVLEALTQNGRQGNTIHIHRVAFRGHTLPAADTDTNDLVRIIFFVDHQASGTTPTVAKLLHAATTDAFREESTMARFTILQDFFFSWSTNSISIAGTPTFVSKQTVVQFFKKVNFETHYLQSANTFAAITKNSIGVLTISDSAQDTNLEGVFRISFTDV